MDAGLEIAGGAMKRESQGVLFPEMKESVFSEEKKKTNHSGWGGAWKGAGKKKKRWREGAPHRRRITPRRWSPHHVTLSLKRDCPSLRTNPTFFFSLQVFQEEKKRSGFLLLAWTLQKNHLHLIVEAASPEALSRSIQGIQVRLARGWNRIWKRKGRVFAGRFHSRMVRSLGDGRRVLAYVLKNHLRHGVKIPCPVDPGSSGLWTDVWLERETWAVARKEFKVEEDPPPLVPPVTETMKDAFLPGSLSLYGRPRGYFRDECFGRKVAEGMDVSVTQKSLFS